jgi:hypothetical protein
MTEGIVLSFSGAAIQHIVKGDIVADPLIEGLWHSVESIGLTADNLYRLYSIRSEVLASGPADTLVAVIRHMSDDEDAQ